MVGVCGRTPTDTGYPGWGDIAEGRDSHERESSQKYFDGGKSTGDDA